MSGTAIKYWKFREKENNGLYQWDATYEDLTKHFP